VLPEDIKTVGNFSDFFPQVESFLVTSLKEQKKIQKMHSSLCVKELSIANY
jgi:hypothetical protein